MTGPQVFHARPDGSVWARSEAWGWLGRTVSAQARTDAAVNGLFSPVALDFLNAAALAATLQVTAPEVPLPEPLEAAQVTMWESVEDAASRRGCSPEYVRRLARRGHIKAQRAGRCWLIEAHEGANHGNEIHPQQQRRRSLRG